MLINLIAPATSPPKPCKEHLDIAVIIDSSDRISPAGYDLVRQYLIRLADRLQISGAGTHMAILLYSWEAHTWHRSVEALSQIYYSIVCGYLTPGVKIRVASERVLSYFQI